MENAARMGRTVLFVSHNMAAVEALCPRTILLEEGAVIADGGTHEVVTDFLQCAELPEYDVNLADHPDRIVDERRILRRFRVEDSDGVVSSSLRVGQHTRFLIEIESSERVPQLALALHFYSSLSQRVMTLASNYQSHGLGDASVGSTSVICECENLQLAPGIYRIVLACAAGGASIDRIDPVATIEIVGSDYYGTGKTPPPVDGVFWPSARWHTAK